MERSNKARAQNWQSSFTWLTLDCDCTRCERPAGLVWRTPPCGLWWRLMIARAAQTQLTPAPHWIQVESNWLETTPAGYTAPDMHACTNLHDARLHYELLPQRHCKVLPGFCLRFVLCSSCYLVCRMKSVVNWFQNIATRRMWAMTDTYFFSYAIENLHGICVSFSCVS